MFADGLGCEIAVSEARETGTLGAAMAAAIGAGLFRDEEEAVAAMTRLAARIYPIPECASITIAAMRYGSGSRRRSIPSGESSRPAQRGNEG